MTTAQDLLYSVFESHLYEPAPAEQTVEEFVEIVVDDYFKNIPKHGLNIPMHFKPQIEDDIKDEVLIMTRKKIYGYSSLSEYRIKNIFLLESATVKRSS